MSLELRILVVAAFVSGYAILNFHYVRQRSQLSARQIQPASNGTRGFLPRLNELTQTFLAHCLGRAASS
jgi:hypothetical protein